MSLDGVYSVLPTAFSDSGTLDLSRQVVDLLINNGLNRRTGLGAAGEPARLDDQERAKGLETVISQPAGPLPVVACPSPDGTRACIGYSRRAMQLGAAAVMGMPSRIATRHSDAVAQPYKALASSATRAPAEAPTTRAFDCVLTWVTTQKGFEWISG